MGARQTTPRPPTFRRSLDSMSASSAAATIASTPEALPDFDVVLADFEAGRAESARRGFAQLGEVEADGQSEAQFNLAVVYCNSTCGRRRGGDRARSAFVLVVISRTMESD